MASKPSQTLTIAEQAAWLRAHGWHQDRFARWPWEWWKAPFRGMYYRLKDAVDIERSRHKS